MWIIIIVGIISRVSTNSEHLTALTATGKENPNGANIKNTKQSDVVKYDPNVDPITHLEMIAQTIEMDRRVRRNPQSKSFDRGYDDFLRNYQGDNDRRDNYKVKESEEDRSESDENDDEEDSSGGVEDDDEASHEKSRGAKNRDKNYKKKNDDDYDRIKQESGKSKTSKYCKREKRGNMLCNICDNPKNEEKSESCKLNSDPKDKKYAYSNEKKYSHKDDDEERESFEEAREFTTKRPQRPFNNRYPIKPNPPQLTYRRVQRPNVPYSIIRYRTIPLPRPQRIRIITLPGPPPSLPPATPLPTAQYRPYPFTVLESRPQRDTVWLANRRPYSEHLIAPQNGPLNKSNPHDHADRQYAKVVTKDWSECRKYIDGELLCFECEKNNGNSNKECMFATHNKPEENRQPYAKSNTYDLEKDDREQSTKTAPKRRQAKIHPAWQISSNSTPDKINSAKETKRTLDPKLNQSNKQKVQRKLYGGEPINSKPKEIASFYKFNNGTNPN